MPAAMINEVLFNDEPFEKYYAIGERLGSGQFACVYRCTHRVTGVDYAAKLIQKRRFQSSSRGAKRADIEREVCVLRSVGAHTNIIALFEVYESKNDVVLVLELTAGGELFDYVCSRDCLSEVEAAAFVRQILDAVQHLHKHCIVHLDIKPENVMLLKADSLRVKLIDFGLSRVVLPGIPVRDMIGTPEFVAPEIVNYEPLSAATDMWAIGVLTYILLSGISPFLGQTREETFCNITAVFYEFCSPAFDGVSKLAKDFIRCLFVRDPRKRGTAAECLDHPWITGQAYHAVVICIRLTRRARLRAAPWPSSSSAARLSSLDSRELLRKAFFCASVEGNVAGLAQLTSVSSVDLDMSGDAGQTAVHVGAGCGQFDVVQLLHLKGADIRSVDKQGDTPLIRAARNGHAAVVRYLCEEGVQLNHQNNARQTALHEAARYSHTECAALLCEFGADMNVQDEGGQTALIICCSFGFAMLVDVLLRFQPDVRLQNEKEETALHCAVQRGHIECCNMLLERGAALDYLDKNGQTALHVALDRQFVDIAFLLLGKGCRLDVQDMNGDTCLHMACRAGLLSVVQTLCHLGCAVDTLNTSGVSPLHIAAREGSTEIIRCLCLAGANVGIKSKDGLTPEAMAFAHEKSVAGNLLSRLKGEHQREMFINQLCPTEHGLRRIKLKLFGNSAVGKSRLAVTLQTGVIGNLLGGLSRRWSDGYSSKDESNSEESAAKKWRNNSLRIKPAHAAYTRGIDVQNVGIPGAGEFSLWEFSGYEPYHQTFDHFVGNTDCVHLIVFRATDPPEVQYEHVLYWLNFLRSRVAPSEPIAHGGVLCRRARVALVATHADRLDACDTDSAAAAVDALVGTARVRFADSFDVHERVAVVDATNANSPAVKTLRSYLATTRSQIVSSLPKTLGVVDAASDFLQLLRRQQSAFPVLTWPRFLDLMRLEVNPLVGDSHSRHLIQQLQLIGEVVYLKDVSQDLDYVVLSAEWLGTHVIGSLLSAEFLARCRITGCYGADDFLPLFPDVTDSAALLQILDTLQLCAQSDLCGDVEYEFAAFVMLEPPRDAWAQRDSSAPLVYGGVRVQAARASDAAFHMLFARVQVALRRSMQDFHDPIDAELVQWHLCSKILSGQMEALVRCVETGRDGAVEVLVRGPADLCASCFYFLEDVVQIAEQTVADVAPGLPLERHFLSPRDLAAHKHQPAVYTPEAIMAMQQRESLSATNNREGEELFLDIVCFGSRDVAAALTLGVDVSVAGLPLGARRQLAALLDPADAMGRDWSILAVRLGLTDQLPDVDSNGQTLSRTDQLLAEWALHAADAATVGRLCETLADLGRADAVAALRRAVPLYLFAAADETPSAPAKDGADSGLASSDQSHSTVSQRSASVASA